eukprot:5695003-Pyramimonas_sp.AAC.1
MTQNPTTDAEVLAIAGRMEFKQVLRFRRLSYVARLMHAGPPTLRLVLDATVGAPMSWASMVADGVSWMRCYCAEVPDAPPDTIEGLAESINFVAADIQI